MILTDHWFLHQSAGSSLLTVHQITINAPQTSLYIIQVYLLLTDHCTLQNCKCSSLHTIHCTALHAPQCWLYIKQLYILLTAHCTLHSPKNPHCTLNIAQLFSQFVRVSSQNIYTRISEFLKTISTSKQIKYKISSKSYWNNYKFWYWSTWSLSSLQTVKMFYRITYNINVK